MSSLSKISFKRNLDGFLKSSWLTRSTAATRLTRTTKSLSADPIEPIDAVFTTVSEHYDSQDHLAGFQSVTRQLLANDVMNSLIQIQSEMLGFDQLIPYGPDLVNAHVSDAYRQARALS